VTVASELFPDWIEEIRPKTRKIDVLGLRLLPQIIGNELLDGITTVTANPRYLSIATLVARSYALLRRPNSQPEFLDYAANFEAVLALASTKMNSGRPGIIGVTEATRALAASADPVPVPPLVETPGTSTFQGACFSLGLLQAVDNSSVPAVTVERGLPISRLQERVLSECALGRALLHGQQPTEVSRADLDELGRAFDLTSFLPQESQLLLDAILPSNPGPKERSRLATYSILLTQARRGKVISKDARTSEEQFFLASADTESGLPASLGPVADMWLAYQCRDAIAVLHEAALETVVRHLSSGNTAATVSSVLSGLLGDHALLASALSDTGLPVDANQISSLDWKTFESLVTGTLGRQAASKGIARWRASIRELGLIRRALSGDPGAVALLPVVWLLAAKRLVLDASMDQRNASVADPDRLGESRIGVRKVIVPTLLRYRANNPRLTDVIAELIHRTVKQHLRVSWARLSRDPTMTDIAVLTEEGERWFVRDAFSAGRTDSRIRVAISWLSILGLVGPSGITDLGILRLASTMDVLDAPQ
jgi:hypothetical protein